MDAAGTERREGIRGWKGGGRRKGVCAHKGKGGDIP